MPTTYQSVTATPGRGYAFVAKTAAAQAVLRDYLIIEGQGIEFVHDDSGSVTLGGPVLQANVLIIGSSEITLSENAIMANYINHDVKLGVTKTYDLLVKDSDSVIIDLSSYTSRLHVRRNAQAAIFLECTDANGNLTMHRGGVTGRVSITLTESDTESLEICSDEEDMVYDWELVGPSGEVYELARGTWTWERAVTR